MLPRAHRAIATGHALRGVVVRVVLTSSVLGGWLAAWWILRHGHLGAL